MASWKEVFKHLSANAESKFDQYKYRFYYAMGGPGPIVIVPYRGYGTSEQLYLKGRVLEDRGITEAGEKDKFWKNLINMYKRAQSNEVPGARLLLRFQGQEQEVVADDEGFFEGWIKPQTPLPANQLWHSVEIELLSPIPKDQALPVKATAQVLVPTPSARYVVISDIDDTVLQTDLAHLLKMARNVFLGNARTRLPFPGVAALYRALFAGQSGLEMNPMFYVSSSPWNLYDLLAQFFNLHGIPIGPVLFLRDWGLTREEILPTRNKEYKIKTIRQMLRMYPHLPFILIGDSSQEDPEIYADIASENKSRILSVYIRNVNPHMRKPEAVKELAERVVEVGSALVMADDSYAIAKHAAERGYISATALPAIQANKDKDQAPPSPLDQLLGQDDQPEAPTVKVESEGKEEAKDAIQSGAIEEAVKEPMQKKPNTAPTVVVDTQEAKDKSDRKTNNK